MANVKLIIDGTDFTDYIAFGGYKWQREDADGPGAGRDLTGDLTRKRLATKRRLDITCRPLKDDECAKILTAIMPEWVTVQYYDPQQGGMVQYTMYSNNNPASHEIHYRDGTSMWGGVTFPLIQK